MDVGVSIAGTHRLSAPGAVRVAAAAAEQVGYSSLWAVDRPGAGSSDPFLVLALASAVTSRIRLGVLVGDPASYGDGVLARAAETLHRLSEGRSQVARSGEVVLVEVTVEEPIEEVVERIVAAGVDEVVLAVAGDPSLDETLDVYARVTEALLARC